MDNIGQQWITMDNNGQQWITMDNNLRCFMHLWCRFVIVIVILVLVFVSQAAQVRSHTLIKCPKGCSLRVISQTSAFAIAIKVRYESWKCIWILLPKCDICVRFKQWLNMIWRKLTLLSLNSMQPLWIPRAQPKCWQKIPNKWPSLDSRDSHFLEIISDMAGSPK